MKFSDIPRLIRREQAGDYLSAPQLFAHMEEAGWIKPAVSRHRMTLFDRKKIDECVERLNRGEYPTPA